MGLGNKSHRTKIKKTAKGYGYASFGDLLIIVITVVFIIWFLFRFC